MKKQNKFSQSDSSRLDDQIKKILDASFPLPEKVENARNEAFTKIRATAAQKQETPSDPAADSAVKLPLYEQNDADDSAKMARRRRMRKHFFRSLMAAGAAVFVLFCVFATNPAYAAQVDLVGSIFHRLEGSLEFAGDFAKLAEPVKKSEQAIEGITIDGNTITLSEVYCNKAALYLSLVIHSKEKLPDTEQNQDGKPIIYLKNMIDFNFVEEGAIDWAIGGDPYLDGEMVDENTFAGVLRFDLEQYFSTKNIQVPENFQVTFSVSQIAGSRKEDASPQMPRELKERYEAGMKENGLGLTDNDYEQFTEEQKDIEHQLFSEMWNAYYEMYPERSQFPNKYQYWLMDGPWEFTFDVTMNNEDVIRKDINDVDENGLGLISVTKTPMEISFEVEENTDYYVTVLDADGNEMTQGGFSGYPNTFSVNGHDASKIDIYICDYIEYMDELKVYLWSEDYEEKAKQKTFKQLLDERALYHKEIIFDQ